MRLTPTPSPTYEDTDEEEVDELASSPVKIKPIDYGDSEEDEDDDDGIESLFTPPPRKNSGVSNLISFEDHGERYDEGGTSVALSPSPSGPDVRLSSLDVHLTFIF